MKDGIKATWDILKFLIGVILVAFLLKAFIFQPFLVEGISMEPNYHDKEYILVNKAVYVAEKPERGDVIIFRPPDNLQVTYIKRVIGLPGDEIKIGSGKVYINNNLLDEKYLPANRKTLIDSDIDLTSNTKLGNKEYFVMGDNRDHSTDSRVFGIVPRTNIVGKAWMVVYPTEYFGFAKHIVYNMGLSGASN